MVQSKSYIFIILKMKSESEIWIKVCNMIRIWNIITFWNIIECCVEYSTTSLYDFWLRFYFRFWSILQILINISYSGYFSDSDYISDSDLVLDSNNISFFFNYTEISITLWLCFSLYCFFYLVYFVQSYSIFLIKNVIILHFTTIIISRNYIYNYRNVPLNIYHTVLVLYI